MEKTYYTTPKSIFLGGTTTLLICLPFCLGFLYFGMHNNVNFVWLSLALLFFFVILFTIIKYLKLVVRGEIPLIVNADGIDNKGDNFGVVPWEDIISISGGGGPNDPIYLEVRNTDHYRKLAGDPPRWAKALAENKIPIDITYLEIDSHKKFLSELQSFLKHYTKTKKVAEL
jgi:hypothetical protein